MYTIPPRKRKPHIYKTTYLSETLAEKIEEVAAKIRKRAVPGADRQRKSKWSIKSNASF